MKKNQKQLINQSIIDLISNRNALKSAIIKSNATTKVTINNKTMTVAEAIERKKSIQYEETLLKEMKNQYENAKSIIKIENRKVNAKVSELLAALIGKDTSDKKTNELQETIEKAYIDKNEYELTDSISISKKIEELETEIENFKAAADTSLVISNSTTTIEVDF